LLPAICEKAARNGIRDLKPVDPSELYQLEPKLGTGAQAAVLVPRESITCPFTPVLAFASTAVTNGVALYRDFPVHAVERGWGAVVLRSSHDEVRSRVVINAAGLRSDEFDRLFGKDVFTVHPRKGEFLVFDKPATSLIHHILLPVPTARTKGVLITRTVFGNLLLGPTAIDVTDKEDVSVSTASIRALLDTGYRILPDLRREDVTCTYAGLRAATEHQDYQINFYPSEKYVTVGGIRSTGLSGSLGISEYVVNRLLADFDLSSSPRPDWKPYRAPSITNLEPRTCENLALISSNPAYGAIVCYCEWVSKGEIQDALRSSIPARDLDGIKRRTRATLGRCQGFNCYAPITRMLQVQ